MKVLIQTASCGCRFSEDGVLVTTCAGHKEVVVPAVLQRARRLADVTPIRRHRRFLHALARLWGR